MTERFWEIDFFRGIALLLMLLFNWSYTLLYLDIYRVAEGDLYWWLFPRLIASAFIIIAGVVLSIGYAKQKDPKKYLKRGAFIFSMGLLVTVATWLYVPSDYVLFGILHLIGFCIMISPFFLRMSNDRLLLISGVFIAAGFLLQNAYFDFPWLVWLGFMPYNFNSLDYFPVLPWLGIMIIGFVLGNIFYTKGKRQFISGKMPGYAAPLVFIGQRSLLIYLIHQPLLLILLQASGLL